MILKRYLTSGIISALIASTLSVSALAEKPKTVVQINQAMSDGQTAVFNSEWNKARALLIEVWDIQQSWKIAYPLGKAEFKLGMMRDAAEHLRFFLDTAPNANVKDRESATAMLTTARNKIGAAKINLSPEDSELFLNDKAIKLPPSSVIFLEPGPQTLEVRSKGFDNDKRILNIGAGKKESVVVILAKTKEIVKQEPKKIKEVIEPKRNKILTIVGASATAVHLTMAGTFLALSEVKRSERDNTSVAKNGCLTKAECELYNSPEVARGRFLTASFVSLLAAGVIGTGTLAYVLSTSSNKANNKNAPTVAVGPGSISASIPW